jgi:hypothetical protein
MVRRLVLMKVLGDILFGHYSSSSLVVLANQVDIFKRIIWQLQPLEGT